jgi:hypothetical protein
LALDFSRYLLRSALGSYSPLWKRSALLAKV